MRPSLWSDETVERIVGNLLRAGVLLAAVVVFVGAVVFLARDGAVTPHYQVFQGEPGELKSIPLIARGSLSGGGRSIIMLGLLLLLATPIARVAFSVFAFAMQRDFTYVGITILVLSGLLYSLLGKHG